MGTQILDADPELHFYLLRLHLIELIRVVLRTPGNPQAQAFAPALEFATKQLAPRAPSSPVFLKDLEQTMALLIYPADKIQSPLKELLDPALRHSVAARVNEAILVSQGRRREAHIRHLVRLRAWAEQKARDAKSNLPPKIDTGLNVPRDEDEEMS